MYRCTIFWIASYSLEADGMISLFMVLRELLPALLLENSSYAAVFSWSCIECESAACFINLIELSLLFMLNSLFEEFVYMLWQIV